jgi:hypothetical protein
MQHSTDNPAPREGAKVLMFSRAVTLKEAQQPQRWALPLHSLTCAWASVRAGAPTRSSTPPCTGHIYRGAAVLCWSLGSPGKRTARR